MIPRLHLITDDEVLAREGFPAAARAALEAGGPAIALHLRGPGATGRSLHSLASELLGPAARSGSAILVNDRLDIALTLPLAGAHLGQRSLPPADARRLLGQERVLGLSVHDGGEARLPGVGEMDFLVVGSIFSTSSHPRRRPGGLERIREVSAVVPGMPLVAIGGVTPARVGEIRAAGAHGVAVLSGIWASREPASAVLDYLDALGEPQGRKGPRSRGAPG